jgi:hypothetical protein
MPRALRQQLLEDQLDKGRISLPTYQKRSVYADVRDIQMGDTDHWQRAQWINTLIEDQWEELAQMDPMARYQMPAFAILWQDVDQQTPQPQQAAMGQASQMPAFYRTVHKPALMEIILDERKPWVMRQLAMERWGIYDQLERAMNDPTGATPMPPEVMGAPADKMQSVMMQEMGMGGGQVPPGQPGAAGQPPQPSGGPPPGPATSPAGEISGAGIPAAQQLPTPQLGGHGSVEQSVANQQT